MTPITIGYSPAYLQWKGSAASPQRARLSVEHILARAEHEGHDVNVIEPKIRKSTARELRRVHSRRHVNSVLSGFSGEWKGRDEAQGNTATLMFEGTRVLVEQMIEDDFAMQVYFNPQGAKHHAQFATSSGFCVFNDMAYAAEVFTSMGKKVAYLDWDAHHGDGVENLTRSNPDVLTASIHQFGFIFPGTGLKSDRKASAYNFPMSSGDGDAALSEAIWDALDLIRDFQPDVILLACGADGLKGDPLSALEYTVEGLADSAVALGELAAELRVPVLIGGSGGYQPFTHTPVAWAETVHAIAAELRKAAVDQIPEFPEDHFEWPAEAVEDSVDDEDAEIDRVEEILEALANIPIGQWEDVLTRAEYDLVQERITPLLLKAAEAGEIPY